MKVLLSCVALSLVLGWLAQENPTMVWIEHLMYVLLFCTFLTLIRLIYLAEKEQHGKEVIYVSLIGFGAVLGLISFFHNFEENQGLAIILGIVAMIMLLGGIKLWLVKKKKKTK